MKIFALAATLLALLFLPRAEAAVFDAADILPQNSAAGGMFGEILLSDPSSEGIEARGRYGYSDDLNLAAILGVGSKSKRFRLGGEAVYNFIPDWEGQFGLSAIAGAQYLRRETNGGLQMRIGPMGHKKVKAWNGLPATVYLAVPFYLEGRGGAYTTGSQLVLGSFFDISQGGRTYFDAEAGIRLAKLESYILVGVGYRFGDLRFERKNRQDKQKPKGNGTGKPDYREEDFE